MNGRKDRKTMQPLCTTPMRIGYLVPEFPGQTHAFFWREIAALRRLDVDVDVISTRRPPDQIVPHAWSAEATSRTIYLFPLSTASLIAATGALLRAGPRRWLRCISAAIRAEAPLLFRLKMLAAILPGAILAAKARRGGWRHVHVHSCSMSAVIALQASLIFDITYSLTLHGPLHDYGPAQPTKWRYASGAIVITDLLRREVSEQLQSSVPAKLLVAPMGVDTSRFTRQRAYSPYERGAVLRLFSCGRLNPCKAHEDVIRAVALLGKQGLRAELRIAGEDTLSGKPYRAFLEGLVRELGVTGQVTLLGATDEAQVRQELESAHVFVLASLEEPLGVAIMEAMAIGTPVVATRGGGVPELIDEGTHGILVAPRKPEEITSALLRLASSKELAQAMAMHAKERVEARFDSRISAEAIAKIARNAAGT